MQSTTTRRWNFTKVNLWYDLGIFVAALLAPALFLTGLTIHEWLGIGLGIAIIAHLLLHWSWITQITRRFLTHTSWIARINYVLNLAFFVDMTIIIATGLLISRVALPLIGIEGGHNMTWKALHTLASDAMILILALHVAMHWKWLLNAAQRYIVQPVVRPFRRLTAQPAQKSLNEGGLS